MKFFVFYFLIVTLLFISVSSLPHERNEKEDQVRIGNIIAEKLKHRYENEKPSFTQEDQPKKPKEFSAPPTTKEEIQGLDDSTVNKIEDFISKLLTCTEANGLSIGITTADGSVHYTKGFGTRSTNGEAVDTNTVFPLASITKGFTGFLIAKLAAEGKIDVNSDAGNYLKGFKLDTIGDADLVSTRDLLTHFSGYPSHGYDIASIATGTPFSPEYITERIRNVPAQIPARQQYLYNNIVYSLAGFLAARVRSQDISDSGTDWHQMVQSEILDVLGMSDTTTNVTNLDSFTDNWVTPMTLDGTELPLDSAKWTRTVAPAGSMASTPKDMLKWIRMLLNQGSHDGNQILSPASIAEMVSPKVTIVPSTKLEFAKPDGGTALYYPQMGYGYGWVNGFYNSQTIVHHSGSLIGSEAQLTMSPERGIGIVSMSNKDRTAGVMQWLHLYILDILSNQNDPLFTAEDVCQGYPSPPNPAEKPSRHSPSRDINAYVGDYHQPFMGTISVSAVDENTLNMTFGEHLQGTLISIGSDHFVFADVEWKINDNFTTAYGGLYPVEFEPDVNSNDILGVAVKLYNSVPPITFTKGPTYAPSRVEATKMWREDEVVHLFTRERPSERSSSSSSGISDGALAGAIVGSIIGSAIFTAIAGLVAVGAWVWYRRRSAA
eukprot:gb/GECH01011730.1/.p1 GENE.gb/GECH01011730.1/~~gb/GECH01011730.1/.p1  ORF type:complete len:661 (+),score=126.83 gb/GECH01011730.1/:1-1983(+)